MAEGDERKSILVVEDSRDLLDKYRAVAADRGYDVTTIFYNGPDVKIPGQKFDYVILGELDGGWESVANKVQSERISVFSDNVDVIKRVGEKGLQCITPATILIKRALEVLAE